MPTTKELNERIIQLEKQVNDLQGKAESLTINDKKTDPKPKKPKAKTCLLYTSPSPRD